MTARLHLHQDSCPPDCPVNVALRAGDTVTYETPTSLRRGGPPGGIVLNPPPPPAEPSASSAGAAGRAEPVPSLRMESVSNFSTELVPSGPAPESAGITSMSPSGMIADRIAEDLIKNPDATGVRFTLRPTMVHSVRKGLADRVAKLRPGWTSTLYVTDDGDYFAAMVRKMHPVPDGADPA